MPTKFDEFEEWATKKTKFTFQEANKQFPEYRSLKYDLDYAVKFHIISKDGDTYAWRGIGSHPVTVNLGDMVKPPLPSLPTVRDIPYNNWGGALEILRHAYEARVNPLVIGLDGSGKTALCKYFAASMKKELIIVNFNVAMKPETIEQLINKSMLQNTILNLDNLSYAPPELAIKLDEILDRHTLTMEDGTVVSTQSDWFVIGTVTPSVENGNRHIPKFLVGKFPVRVFLKYPPEEIELSIIKQHVSGEVDNAVAYEGVLLANKLRKMYEDEKIHYSPNLRETITFAKLLQQGVSPYDAACEVFRDVYYEWSNKEAMEVHDEIVKLFQKVQR